jgi:hypothetical protein
MSDGAPDGERESASSEDALAGRVRELEERIDELESLAESQRFVISMLTAYADLEPLDPAPCPSCGEASLVKRSGLTWSKALCTSCGSDWVLSR